MDIWTVLTVGTPAQTTAAKTYANPAWHAIADVAGSKIDIILKAEPLHRLVKELLAVGLADRLAVPHIPGWAVSLDLGQAHQVGITSGTSDPADASRIILFGSRRSSGVPIAPSGGLTDPHLEASYYRSSDAVSILVFDELIGNFDRLYENIMTEAQGFLAFDHDKILLSDTSGFAKLPSSAGQPCLNIVSDAVGVFANGTRSTAIASATGWITTLTKPIDLLWDIAGSGLLSSIDAQSIEDYLLARLPLLPKLVEAHY